MKFIILRGVNRRIGKPGGGVGIDWGCIKLENLFNISFWYLEDYFPMGLTFSVKVIFNWRLSKSNKMCPWIPVLTLWYENVNEIISFRQQSHKILNLNLSNSVPLTPSRIFCPVIQFNAAQKASTIRLTTDQPQKCP